MTNRDKSVFVCYRREPSKLLSLVLFKRLNDEGFKVFRDQESIGPGLFEKVILSQIAAHAHFVVLLAHGTLDRCSASDDWVRREIEFAIDLDRNIIPILVDGFSIEDADKHLTGKLAELKKYQTHLLFTDFGNDYLELGLRKLIEEKLQERVDKEIRPVSQEAKAIADQVTQEALEEYKEEYPDEGEKVSNTLRSIINAREDLRKVQTLNHREQYLEALELVDKVARVIPNKADVYAARADANYGLGRLPEAIEDYTKAIGLEPGQPFTYSGRAQAYRDMGENHLAIEDFEMTLAIAPELDGTLFQLGFLYFKVGQFERSIELLQQVVDHPKIPAHSKETALDIIHRARNVLNKRK